MERELTLGIRDHQPEGRYCFHHLRGTVAFPPFWFLEEKKDQRCCFHMHYFYY